MIIWLDAQLSPKLAFWIKQTFKIDCIHVRDLKLLTAKDEAIFHAAKKVKAIVASKDRDFKDLVLIKGAPPQVLWISCGNTSNARLQKILQKMFPEIIKLFKAGESLVEITAQSIQ